MIELYRPLDCPTCRDIEDALKEMVLAHKVIIVEPGRQPDALAPDTPLPTLKDNGQTITGQAAIEAYLRELEKIAEEWRKYQGDSCYVDGDSGLGC